LIDVLLKRSAVLLKNQFFRFLLVGGINTLFGYSVFALLLFINFHYAVAAFFSTILGVLFNFKTTGVLVFDNGDNRLIMRFIAVYGVVYLMNIAGLKAFNIFHVNNYISGLILVFPMAVAAYFINKKFVFNSSK